MERRHREKTVKRVAAAVVFAVCLLAGAYVFPAGIPSHLDSVKNPQGCAACHKGHGQRGTFMLPAGREELCFTCHSPGGGAGPAKSMNDIQSTFYKVSKHPVLETSLYHFPAEELPESDPGTPRHVACADCHRIHVLEENDVFRGVKGHVPGKGKALGLDKRAAAATREYELCYKCHSESRNLPPDATDKSEEFLPSNPSFHPVEVAGRNSDVPSLIPPLNANSTIDCSGCHGNDDPFGPKGPHGSGIPPLLKMRYERLEIGETPEAYELCYSCHDRDNILGNNSFNKHREHIVFNRVPCAACHTPHGSSVNRHLIEFSPAFVDAAPMPSYTPGIPGRPTCMLRCHVSGLDVLHDTDFYLNKQWP